MILLALIVPLSYLGLPPSQETEAEADGVEWQAAGHDDEDDEEWEEA